MTDATEKEKFVRVVSFNTMTDKDLPDFSFTLRAKSPGYKRTRRSRTFMVATDLANYSEYALTWATDDIMDDGDELIVLRVVTVDMHDKKSGNVTQVLETEAKVSREKANQVMERIMKTSGVEKKISVIIEFVIGRVQETIQHMITMYQPSLLIVGSRGLSEIKGMLVTSISKYCLQHSPVPVAVVRPENKSKKSNKMLGGLMHISSANTTSSRLTEEEEEDNADNTTSTSRKLKRLSLTNKKT